MTCARSSPECSRRGAPARRRRRLFDKGESVPDALPSVARPRAAIASVDAHAAPGPVAQNRAADEAVACARDCGVGWA
jgi:LDH2 family malate/lactate/ureidoglycolate dehydrogenase